MQAKNKANEKQKGNGKMEISTGMHAPKDIGTVVNGMMNASSVPSESTEAYDMRIRYFTDEIGAMMRRISAGSRNYRSSMWKVDGTFDELKKAGYEKTPEQEMFLDCFASLKAGRIDEAIEIYARIIGSD